MKDDMTPRQCAVCGKTFIPRRRNQKSCGDPACVYAWKNRNLKTRNASRNRIKQATMRVPKPDTIVAIGYAERQMARSLEMAGKVRTEL